MMKKTTSSPSVKPLPVPHVFASEITRSPSGGTTTYLKKNFSFAQAFKLTSKIISGTDFHLSIADGFDKDYSDNIFADADPDSYLDSKDK